MLPILALTTGDPAGIGPEVVCRALFSPEVQAVCRPLVIGDGAVLRRAAAACGLAIGVRDVVEAGAADAPGDAGDPDRPLSVAVLDPLALSGAWEGPALTDLPLGAVSAAARRRTAALPTTRGRHTACTSELKRARETTSGPMPAGSPVVSARIGSMVRC